MRTVSNHEVCCKNCPQYYTVRWEASLIIKTLSPAALSFEVRGGGVSGSTSTGCHSIIVLASKNCLAPLLPASETVPCSPPYERNNKSCNSVFQSQMAFLASRIVYFWEANSFAYILLSSSGNVGKGGKAIVQLSYLQKYE